MDNFDSKLDVLKNRFEEVRAGIEDTVSHLEDLDLDSNVKMCQKGLYSAALATINWLLIFSKALKEVTITPNESFTKKTDSCGSYNAIEDSKIVNNNNFSKSKEGSCGSYNEELSDRTKTYSYDEKCGSVNESYSSSKKTNGKITVGECGSQNLISSSHRLIIKENSISDKSSPKRTSSIRIKNDFLGKPCTCRKRSAIFDSGDDKKPSVQRSKSSLNKDMRTRTRQKLELVSIKSQSQSRVNFKTKTESRHFLQARSSDLNCSFFKNR